MDELDKEYTIKVNEYKRDRDRKLADAHREYTEKVTEAMAHHAREFRRIEAEHMKSLHRDNHS